MNARPALPRPHLGTTVVAALLSVLVAIGLLSAVAGLFQREGAPFERLVIAERVCGEYAFVSEREACVRQLLVTSTVWNVAGR